MAIETGLEGKPWYICLVAGLVLAGAIVWGGHAFKLKKMEGSIARQEKKLEELRDKIREGRAAEAQLPQFREEARRLELELTRLLNILPAKMNTQDLLRRFRALAQQGDLDLLRISPNNVRPIDFYSEWPIRFTIQGGYHNLALFFDRVSRFARIINIENLQIRSQRNRSNRTISTSFVAKTFLYNEPEEEEEDDEL